MARLDLIPRSQLEEELQRRDKAHAKGRCDYCGKGPNTPACKYPDRHRAACTHCGGAGFIRECGGYDSSSYEEPCRCPAGKAFKLKETSAIPKKIVGARTLTRPRTSR
jgi:hypothetical protein